MKTSRLMSVPVVRGVTAVLALSSLLACDESRATPPRSGQLPIVWRLVGASDPGAASWSGRPASEDEQVFFETATGVVAIDSPTGVVAWKASLWRDKRPTSFNIVVQADRVFVNELDSVFALARGDGRRLWSRSVGAPVNFHHAIASGDLLLTTTYQPSVVALDAESGATRWELTLPASWDSGGILTGLGASGDTIYVAANEYFIWNGAEKRGVLLALDRATGRVLWSWSASDRHSSAGPRIVVSGPLLLVGDAYGNSFFAVDRFTGEERWRVTGAADSFGPEEPPEVRGDTAYVGSNDRFVYAVDVSTGAVFWRRLAGGSVSHSAVCGPYVLANMLALAVVPRDGHRAVSLMLSEENGADGFPTSGIAVVGDIAVFATSRGIIAVRCT